MCAVLLALVAPAETRAGPKQVEAKQIGRWSLVAFAGDPDEYASCSIAVENQAGVEFGVWTDTLGDWRMTLASARWQLKEGTEYDIRYAIDDQAPVRQKALAVIDKSVHIPFARDFAATGVLRHGNRISFQTAQQTFAFDLAGSARALDEMLDCARRWLHLSDASADPFSSPPSAAVPSDPDIPKRQPGSLSKYFDSAKVGDWTIGVNTNFFNGVFTGCRATAPDAGAYTLIVELDRRSDWRLSVLNNDWNLRPGVPVKLRYGVDDGPDTTAQAEVVIAQIAGIALGKDPPAIAAIRRGRQLHFERDGERFAFDLSGVGRALDATEKCVAHYAAEG